jgi:hypothetical protein
MAAVRTESICSSGLKYAAQIQWFFRTKPKIETLCEHLLEVSFCNKRE